MDSNSSEQNLAEFGVQLEPNMNFAEFSEEQANDISKLEEVGIRILENSASTEDYKLVRDLAQKYQPNQIFKFSPRLLGREASLEGLEKLKQYAGLGLAVAVVMALLALIDHLLGSEGGKGSGGSSAGAASKNRLSEAEKRFNEASDKLSEAKERLRNLSETIDKLTPEASEAIRSAENADEAEKNPVYRQLQEAIKKQSPDLTPEQLHSSVKTVIKIADTYLAMIGGNATYDDIKEHFKQGLDIYKTLNSVIFTAEKVSWCRMRFLSASGFNPSSSLEKAAKLLEVNYQNFAEYRNEIDKLVYAVKHSETERFDYKAFNDKYSNILKGYGYGIGDASVGVYPEKEASIISKEEARAMNLEMKANFELLDAPQLVAKNVLAKLIGGERNQVILELERLDKLLDQAEDLKSWVDKSENSDGGIIELSKTIEEIKNSVGKPTLDNVADSSWNSLNYANGIIKAMSEIIGNILTLVGNFSIGMKKVSVGFVNLSKSYSTIAELVEKLDKVDRGASNESILEDKTGRLPNTTVTTYGSLGSEDELHMREIHIPGNVILPKGIDVNSLRDLVEVDPSNWSEVELEEYSDGVSESLSHLHNDIDSIDEIRDRIARTGMISRSDVVALESIHPGLITNQTPLGRFTSFESVNYAQASLENANNLASGAKMVAGVAAIAILAKILQWCFKRFQASRDVTKSIKGKVEVINKLNDQVISSISGTNGRVEALSPDRQGKLSTEAKTYFVDKFKGSSNWFDIKDSEKMLMTIRLEVFVIEHAKSYSELIHSTVTGGDGYKLLQALTSAAEKGAATLDKAVDNAAMQIDHLKEGKTSNTEYNFTGLDFGLDGFSIKDLKLDKATMNPGKAEIIENYIRGKKEEKLDDTKIRQVEVDKFNARLSEMGEKLKEINGRAESEFKKIQSRLDKLEKANAAAAETDSSDGSSKDNREAVKSYIDSLKNEFTAYSKIVGAHKTILSLLDAELGVYGKTLKIWKGHVDWYNKKIASIAKEAEAS